MAQTLSKMQSREKSPSKIDFQKIQNAKTQIFSEMKKIFWAIFSSQFLHKRSSKTINQWFLR